MSLSLYQGVNMNNVRKALYYLIYGPDYEETEAYKYIIPLQNNFLNPLQLDDKDTYVQYAIPNDQKITQDSLGYKTNYTDKLATVFLRFTGAKAEDWSKFFHHFTQLRNVYDIFQGTCCATQLEAVGDINQTQVSFDGESTVLAYDLEIKLYYKEYLELPWDPLIHVTLAPGEIIT